MGLRALSRAPAAALLAWGSCEPAWAQLSAGGRATVLGLCWLVLSCAAAVLLGALIRWADTAPERWRGKDG